MDRALEQQLDSNYRLQRHIYDLTREYFLLGRDGLIIGLKPPAGGGVLEIGCGTARNMLLAASHYPDARFYGLDLSTMMLETAAAKIAKSDAKARLAIAHADATSFDPAALFGRATFERIFFSYALSMIPRWREAIAHASQFLAPKGELHIVDFGPGERLPGVANSVLRAWLAKFHVDPRDELRGELDRLSAAGGFEARVQSLFGGYATSAVLIRR